MSRVLVIDDEPSLTRIVGKLLDVAGFEVEIAMSGPEGLHKAIVTQPDVVILDIMMPGMDGYEVCRRLRRDPRTARVGIVVLTARGQPIDKQVALRAGADAHIPKPFKSGLLIQEIQRLLAERMRTVLPLGYQILVLRLKEGAGATTLATNLALCLAEEVSSLTVVADIVLQGGQIENRLGLPPTTSWQDASGSDASGLAQHLVRHESGLFALPTPPSSEYRATPVQVAQALQTLREWYDYVVVDTPFNLGPLAPALLRSSPLVLLLLTPEPAAVRAAQASLAAIRGQGSQVLHVWPILRLTGADERFRQQVERVLGLPVAATLPWSPQECARAVATCTPVVLSYPDSRLSAAFADLAHQVVQVAGAQPQRRMPR
jgi:CheY-like chemotaxis protein/MinD-like ATPase involved in chromosome partitioning or flagellar assembly